MGTERKFVARTYITCYVGIQTREDNRTFFEVLRNAWFYFDVAYT